MAQYNYEYVPIRQEMDTSEEIFVARTCCGVCVAVCCIYELGTGCVCISCIVESVFEDIIHKYSQYRRHHR